MQAGDAPSVHGPANGLEQALAQGTQALKALPQTPKRLHVYAGASELRASLIEAHSGACSLQEAQALAAHRLALDAHWTVRCAALMPSAGVLVIALESALVQSVRRLAETLGIQRFSLQAAFLTALAHWTAARSQASAAIVAEPGALITAQMAPSDDAMHAQLSIQASEAASRDLAREQTRLRLCLGELAPQHLWQLSAAALRAGAPDFSLAATDTPPHEAL